MIGAATGKFAAVGEAAAGMVAEVGIIGLAGCVDAVALIPGPGCAFQLVLGCALAAVAVGVAELPGNFVRFSGCDFAANGWVLPQPVPASPARTSPVQAAVVMVRIPAPRFDFGPVGASCAFVGHGHDGPSGRRNRRFRTAGQAQPADRSPRSYPDVWKHTQSWRRSWPRR